MKIAIFTFPTTEQANKSGLNAQFEIEKKPY